MYLVFGEDVHAIAHTQKSGDNLWKLLLPFYLVSPEVSTQLLKFGAQHLLLMKHLVSMRKRLLSIANL